MEGGEEERDEGRCEHTVGYDDKNARDMLKGRGSVGWGADRLIVTENFGSIRNLA